MTSLDDNADDNQRLLTAKVLLLEILVRSLLKEAFREQPDPEQAAINLATRLRTLIEKNLSAMPQEITTDVVSVVVLENFDMFFDHLRSELRKGRRQD